MENMYETEDRGELNNALDKFNWGAFGLNLIWAPFNGAWKDYWPILVLMILFTILGNFFFGLIFSILNLCLCIYCGKKGNEWAWYGKKWNSLEQFEASQKKWAIGFISVIILNIIGFCIFMALGMMFAKTFSSPQGQGKVLSSIYIMEVSQDPKYKTLNTEEEIVDTFVESWNQSSSGTTAAKKYSEDSVLLYSPTGSSREEILTFYKSGECSIDKKNCYMIYNKKYGDKITPITKTYFDFTGKTFVMKYRK